MIDDRAHQFPVNEENITHLCDRRFGIGADGLILLQNQENSHKMVYFNSDGKESTMCGNGGRCFVRFLNDLQLMKDSTKFLAVDGWHYAEVDNDLVKLQMHDIDTIQKGDNYYFLDTGSPHHVIFAQHIADIDVKKEGAKIRYSAQYPEGTNVNFVEKLTPNRLFVRTYERGVEDETYSCGTGVTAAALAYASQKEDLISNEVFIKTLGGNLKVSFEKDNQGFKSIFLIGPADFVFKGKIQI
ncbi:diaminopimelate epimerase [Flavobacteriaceae bacterium Ap0902]|nr:diaminopimelate epimerase [Flavobacteriaceae bacterium Ap0902]